MSGPRHPTDAEQAKRRAPRGWRHDVWCPRLSGPQFDCLCFADRMPTIAKVLRTTTEATR